VSLAEKFELRTKRLESTRGQNPKHSPAPTRPVSPGADIGRESDPLIKISVQGQSRGTLRAVGRVLRLRLSRHDPRHEAHMGRSAESRNAPFLGFQLANFFAKEINVSVITHGISSNELR